MFFTIGEVHFTPITLIIMFTNFESCDFDPYDIFNFSLRIKIVCLMFNLFKFLLGFLYDQEYPRIFRRENV